MEVIEFEPYKVFVLKSVSGPFSITYRYTFEPAETGTKVAVFTEVEPGGFFKLAEPVLTPIVKRHLRISLENLRDLVEAETLVPA